MAVALDVCAVASCFVVSGFFADALNGPEYSYGQEVALFVFAVVVSLIATIAALALFLCSIRGSRQISQGRGAGNRLGQPGPPGLVLAYMLPLMMPTG